jgi:ribosomal subunit interface protein
LIKTDIAGKNYDFDKKIVNYIERKLGGLEKLVPRSDRSTTHLEVVLIDDPGGREDNRYVCDVTLSIKGGNLHSSEGAVNMYASVDIVSAKISAQLRTYKEKHTTELRRKNRLFARFTDKKGSVEIPASKPE